MNWERKVSLALILILLLSVTIIRAEEKVPVSQVTMEETIEIIQADPKLAVEFYKFLARTYIREKKYEEATRTYQRALGIVPKDESLRLALAHLYDWQIKDPRRAALEYEILIEINPEKSEYYTRLAELYLQMGLKEEAIPFLEKVAKVRPDDAYVHSKLGQLYLSRGMYSKAVQAYKEAIRLKPQAAVFHLYLARAYTGWGRNKEAFREYLAAIDREEERGIIDEEVCNETGTYDVWGAILIRAEHLGILPKLIKKFEKKVAQRPNNSLLRKDLARIYTWEGNYEKAVIQCLEAIRLNPKDNVAWYRLGRIYERKKDFNPAVRAYLEIIVKDLGRRGFSRGFTIDMRDNWAALKRIEKITEKRGLYPEVIKEVEKAIERNPTQMEPYWLLANLYQGEKSYDLAIKTYQKIIELEPYRESEIYRRIGDIYVEKKQYEKAITAYEKILAFSKKGLGTTGIEALKRIFLVYEKMGQVEGKLQEYEERIICEPGNVELYQELGGIYEVLKRWEKGSRLYLKALEIAPQNSEIERGSRIFAWRSKQNGALKTALLLFQRFREQEPARAQYTIALIEIYTGLGEKENARSLSEEFIRREPKSSYDLGNIARLYRQQGEYVLAEEWYRRALEKMADSPWYCSQYLFELARFSLSKGNYEKAEELLKEGIRLTPNQPAPYLSLAELYRKEGRYREAKALYKEILGRTEKDWTMDHIVEDIHEALLEIKEKSILQTIAREYEKKLKRDPKNIDLGNYLAQIYKKIEESQKEIEPVEEPLSLGEYGYYEFVEEIE